MPENTSTDYRINGICPKCGELQTFVITIKSTIKEEPEAPETEGKDNEGRGEKSKSTTELEESSDVRPADEKGPAGTTGSADQPADTGKGAGNKKAGGGKSK